VKTATRDPLHRAWLLAAGLMPAVWGPPPALRERRVLVAHRQRRVRQRPQACHRLHRERQAHQRVPPAGQLASPSPQTCWEHLDASALERWRVPQDLPLPPTVDGLMCTGDVELSRLRTPEPWKPCARFLMPLPGCAVVTSMTLLAAIGDLTRFPSAKKPVGSSGLGASVHAAGQRHHTGPRPTPVRRELRTLLVEAACNAVEHPPHWHEEFERLDPSLGTGTAMVAMARKLLVVVWPVLTHRVTDHHAEPICPC
jgi:hypothetical protein